MSGSCCPSVAPNCNAGSSPRPTPRRPDREAPDLLVRPHLALRLAGLRTAAAGPGRAELQRRLPARAVRRPARALGPEGAGRDRTQAGLDLPRCGLAGAAAGDEDRPARAAPVQPAGVAAPGAGLRAGGGTPNRRVVEAIFQHVWHGGADADDATRLSALRRRAGAPARRRPAHEVKAELREAPTTRSRRVSSACRRSSATAAHFWGAEALPMLRAAMIGDPWFDGPAWDEAGRQPPGQQRRAG